MKQTQRDPSRPISVVLWALRRTIHWRPGWLQGNIIHCHYRGKHWHLHTDLVWSARAPRYFSLLARGAVCNTTCFEWIIGQKCQRLMWTLGRISIPAPITIHISRHAFKCRPVRLANHSVVFMAFRHRQKSRGFFAKYGWLWGTGASSYLRANKKCVYMFSSLRFFFSLSF